MTGFRWSKDLSFTCDFGVDGDEIKMFPNQLQSINVHTYHDMYI